MSTPAPHLPPSTPPDDAAPPGGLHRWGRLARWLVPIVLLAIVLRSINWSDFAVSLRGADSTLLSLAGVMLLASIVIQAQRWQVLLESNREAWPRGRVQIVHFAAMFFDLFLPGKLGSDAYRVAMIRVPGRLRHIIVTLVALRLHGMAAGLLVAIIAGGIVLGIKYRHLAVGILIAAAALVIVAVFIVLVDRLARRGARGLRGATGMWSIVGRHYDEARAVFLAMLRDSRTLGRSCFWVALYLAAIIACYWATGRAFGMTLPVSSYIAVAPLLLVLSALPISIQGRGLTEVAAILAWEGARATREQIVLTCFAVYGLAILQGLLGGIASVFIRPRVIPPPGDSKGGAGEQNWENGLTPDTGAAQEQVTGDV